MTTVTGPTSALPVDEPTSTLPVDEPPPIRRVREVAVFHNRFGTLYNDDVIAPSGAAGQYLRWQWNQEGVVVVPVGPDGYALVTAYRYPVQAASLEFPRGGVEADEGLEEAAARELREETGLVSRNMSSLGLIHADTGILAAPVHVFVAQVDPATAQPAEPEAMESVTEPVWMRPEELPRWLAEGRITCGLTLAALTLLHARNAVPAASRPVNLPV
ncbi:NUDIX hydrolase [Streptomyces sp. NBC_00876]|uniref:NUDIX hydrolase n=1 Tax=Streptomyces sp. NBC_00876 TaxID=2975853 RepID=UPI00386B5327|nr:NUDIX hydrolase [Streptomyces sp. NBC_00876]